MPLIDKSALDAFTQGDDELLADIATMFAQHLPDTEARLRLAVGDNDAVALRETAHQLKSQLGYFAAGKLQQLATDLESLGRTGQLCKSEDVVRQLMEGCRCLIEELNGLTGLCLVFSDE